MRHRKDGRQFSRNTSHRRAMFRNLAGNLLHHERIVTTDAKAKELRRVAERLISKAKRLGAVAYTPHEELSESDRAKRLHVSRQLRAFLPPNPSADVAEKVLVELSKRFAARPGGYTRIVKLGQRRGDNASLSLIELVDAPAIATMPGKAEAVAVAEPAGGAAAVTEAATQADDADGDDAEGDDDAADDAEAADEETNDADEEKK